MKLPATVTASVQVLTSAIILLPVYLFTGPLFVAEPTPQSAGALVLLGVLGSGISYWLFIRWWQPPEAQWLRPSHTQTQ